MSRQLPFLVAALFALLLSACASLKLPPDRAAETAQPKTPPVKNVTTFSESLRCMDNLLADYGVEGIYVTSRGIPDLTAKNIGGGTRDMLIAAISRMSFVSKAVVFVDFDFRNMDELLQQLSVLGHEQFKFPNYYIAGSVSQLDENVIDKTASVSVSFTDSDAGLSADQIVSVLSVDLHVGHLIDRQFVPGLATTNTIAVTRAGGAGDIGGRIKKAGIFFNVALDKSEGVHHGVRTLIELSAIELIGKLTEVPYWRCLQIGQTNPEMLSQARAWFDDMGMVQRVSFTQRILLHKGYYTGPLNGVHDRLTRNAIARFQAGVSLIPTGRIDFDLYRKLIADEIATERQATPAFSTEPAVDEVRDAPLSVSLTTDLGSKPIYQLMENLRVSVKLSADAFLYCYYRDSSGEVARIFPNEYQPWPFVDAEDALQIPGLEAGFDIVLDRPGDTERVVCFGTHHDISTILPDRLKVPDLVPMPGVSLEDVIADYRSTVTDISMDELPITIAL